MAVRGVGRSVLSSAESVGLLDTTRRGRLITTLGALPAAEPVPFVADGRRVVVRVVDPDSIRDGDVLSLQVDDIDTRTGAGWSVLVTGSARRIARGDRLVEALCPRATEDWLDRAGELILLADPLIRGVAISPVGATAWAGRSTPDHLTEALHAAVALAARAPSVHGAQPWRWEVTDTGLDLYAGPGLPVPDRRAQLVSCGASLQHARTALVAAGWAVRTLVFPEPGDPDHLARLRPLGRVSPGDQDLRLADAAAHRRADRRPFGTGGVSVDRLAELVAAAHFEDAELHLITNGAGWSRLDSLIGTVGMVGMADPARPADPACPADPAHRGGPARAVGHPAVAVLCTSGDGRRAWLRAGEAVARVLLVAEVRGLAVCPLLPPVEAPEAMATTATTATLRDLTGSGEPQMVLRIGVPAAGGSPPPTRSGPRSPGVRDRGPRG